MTQEHINKFTANLAAKDSSETAAQPSNSNRKREVEEDANGSPKILKPSETGGEFAVELSDSRQVRLSKFKGALYVSIREWYEKDGALAPGKGISLQVAQWHDLIASADGVAAAIEDANTDYICKLSQNKQLSLKQYKGKLQVIETVLVALL